MSREEVKTAINEMLENIPEEALQDVFDYLKSVQDKSLASITLSKNLRTILKDEPRAFRKIGKMISEKEAIEIHSILIDRFGGSNGIRDKELLNSALNRPYQTFDGKELYPEVIDKAAAILESIVKNHPFSDGYKRVGSKNTQGNICLMLIANNDARRNDF
ncbi:Fic family protein [Marivirga tractuosa]|uniref:type II toxin-antitoxin system death-on-curing family toxin n=1 Tax=Marivirga tractuosa TaxID=1006 RepID=UPI0035D08FBB